MNIIELSLFTSRLDAVCDEMGAVLQRAAFSPNIRDRLDFSCAVFNAEGELCAQAAHIPVHLGSMAYAMQNIVSQLDWHKGDMVIVNDPFLGGTHLPDITLIAPVYFEGTLLAFIANRAHHADIGADSPGSMPLSKCLDEEGLIIPPTQLIRQGNMNKTFMAEILNAIRSGHAGKGDFSAQISANHTGVERLEYLIGSLGTSKFITALSELNDYGERLAQSVINDIPNGEYQFSDVMDDDGLGNVNLKITTSIKITEHNVSVDFTGTTAQTEGNINCPLSVAAAAVYYVFRCLMPKQTPACAGSFRPISITAPEGCLLNAKRPAAVAAGNVETSTRIVDVVMGALAQALPDKIPSASHGSMNNLAMGYSGDPDKHGVSDQAWDYYEAENSKAWDYYETIGGGMGASSVSAGIDAVQTHMTNTRNTPIEVMESNYPVRIKQYAIRTGSGGAGFHKGGDGIVREFEFLKPANVTLLTERRMHQPWALNNAMAGECGQNLLNGKALAPKICIDIKAGDCLTIKTPGGGGWGKM
ncbi:MAG: hydantoinase B/oxoprolinase family protein [Gammaproteobacteria bacterium]|nr:hydantoinase B/oxoprolinase family protein [Gammaproteobacteria bacterium]